MLEAARPGSNRCLRAKWQMIFQLFPEVSLVSACAHGNPWLGGVFLIETGLVSSSFGPGAMFSLIFTKADYADSCSSIIMIIN